MVAVEESWQRVYACEQRYERIGGESLCTILHAPPAQLYDTTFVGELHDRVLRGNAGRPCRLATWTVRCKARDLWLARALLVRSRCPVRSNLYHCQLCLHDDRHSELGAEIRGYLLRVTQRF